MMLGGALAISSCDDNNDGDMDNNDMMQDTMMDMNTEMNHDHNMADHDTMTPEQRMMHDSMTKMNMMKKGM